MKSSQKLSSLRNEFKSEEKGRSKKGHKIFFTVTVNYIYLHLNIKEKLIFVPFSRDSHRTPKTINILNQHDRGNVLGHFLSGLGSQIRCRNGFVNQWVKEKKASITDCSSTFRRVNFFTSLQVKGHGSNQIYVHGPSKRVKSASFEQLCQLREHQVRLELKARVERSAWFQQRGSSQPALSRGKTNFVFSAKHVLSTKRVFSKGQIRAGGWDCGESNNNPNNAGYLC